MKVQPNQSHVGPMCGIQENTAEDLKLNVGWIACNNCGKWLHETCAELGGVLDDEYFYNLL